tara:strand:- start:1406 stop:1822 length:417 start_codon:yes stop_codon:yes gene_type:complete
MLDLFVNVNWLAVLAGAVIYMLVGGIWYGPIAGKAWMNEMGVTEEEIKASGSPTAAMIKSFFAAIVMSIGLALILYNPGNENWMEGMLTGLAVAVFIVGGATFPNYAFENKSIRHFLIHMGNVTVAMMLIGAMMGVWR